MRQLDWLSLLNFEVLHYGAIRSFPGRATGKMLSTHLPALGCLQLIVARKRTYPADAKPDEIGQSKNGYRRR
jgi:hypothetical protein